MFVSGLEAAGRAARAREGKGPAAVGAAAGTAAKADVGTEPPDPITGTAFGAEWTAGTDGTIGRGAALAGWANAVEKAMPMMTPPAPAARRRSDRLNLRRGCAGSALESAEIGLNFTTSHCYHTK